MDTIRMKIHLLKVNKINYCFEQFHRFLFFLDRNDRNGSAVVDDGDCGHEKHGDVEGSREEDQAAHEGGVQEGEW